VEDCAVFVTGAGRVESLIVDPVTPRCAFELKSFGFGTEERDLASYVYFGDFDDFRTVCLSNCGNSNNVFLYGVMRGGYANNFIDMAVGVEYDDNSSSEFGRLIDIVAEEKGRDYLIDDSFNQNNEYNRLVKDIFRRNRINKIKVDFDLGDDIVF
jgi:hypothetical protein